MLLSTQATLTTARPLMRRTATSGARSLALGVEGESKFAEPRSSWLSPKWSPGLFNTASCPVTPVQRVQVAKGKRQEEERRRKSPRQDEESPETAWDAWRKKLSLRRNVLNSGPHHLKDQHQRSPAPKTPTATSAIKSTSEMSLGWTMVDNAISASKCLLVAIQEEKNSPGAPTAIKSTHSNIC